MWGYIGSRQQDVDLEFAMGMQASSSVSGANASITELVSSRWYHSHRGQQTDQAHLVVECFFAECTSLNHSEAMIDWHSRKSIVCYFPPKCLSLAP